MILIDTSAWVEFLRDTGSAVCNRVDALLDDEIATCHPVRMEVLGGARDEHRRFLPDLSHHRRRSPLVTAFREHAKRVLPGRDTVLGSI